MRRICSALLAFWTSSQPPTVPPPRFECTTAHRRLVETDVGAPDATENAVERVRSVIQKSAEDVRIVDGCTAPLK